MSDTITYESVSHALTYELPNAGEESADEKILAKFAKRVHAGATFTRDGFLLLARIISHDSLHAPVFHAYATSHYEVDDPIWNDLAKVSRLQSDMRAIANDRDAREESAHVRSRQPLYGKGPTEMFDPKGETLRPPDELLSSIVARAQQILLERDKQHS